MIYSLAQKCLFAKGFTGCRFVHFLKAAFLQLQERRLCSGILNWHVARLAWVLKVAVLPLSSPISSFTQKEQLTFDDGAFCEGNDTWI